MGKAGTVVTFHPEAISDVQQDVLRRLAPVVSKHGFYLAGGTALALQLGHRRSVDFDWFSSSRIDPMRLAQAVREESIAFITGSVETGTLYGTIAGVQVGFLEYRYPLLQGLVKWTDFDVLMASLDDLACMKLNAVAQRSSKKDFIDVYALILEHRPLAELLVLYERKYEAADVGHLLYALSYFDVADEEPMPVLLWDTNWTSVKKAIGSWVREEAG